MARRRQDVTDAELAVLEGLWNAGPATIRQLTDVLYPGGSTAHYATVQKLLERLETKQCVRRRRQAAAHLFEAAIDKEELIWRRLEEMAARLCGGSLTPLLTHLVRGQRLSAGDLKELRALIDQLDNRTAQDT